MIDWNDIGLHTFVAILVTTIAVPYVGFVIVLANAAFWLGRELCQHEDNLARVFTAPQPLLEWVVPAIAGIIPFLIYFQKGVTQ